MQRKNIVRSALLVLVAGTTALSGVATAKGPVPGKPGGADIVEIAQQVNLETGEFDYLLGAVGCLTDAQGFNPVAAVLTGKKKHTLFAPTDAAFEALQIALGVDPGDVSPEVTCTLGNEAVLNVLAYHALQGRRFSNSVFNRNESKLLRMLNGQYVISNPDATLNDAMGQSINVVPGLFDINASNGVIHVINTVMLPN